MTPEIHTPREATLTVAASDSREVYADYRCDGTADEVQINAAITAVIAAGGGKVVLMEGTYDIDASIALFSASAIVKDVILEGQGWGTILTAGGAINVIQVGHATYHSRVIVRDMQIDGDSKTGEVGLYILNAARSKFENMYIHDFDDWGVDCHENHSLTFDYLFIELCGDATQLNGVPYVGGMKLGNAPDDKIVNASTISNCIIENNHDGIWLVNGVDNLFIGSVIEANDRHGIVLDQDEDTTHMPILTRIESCYFEDNNVGDTEAGVADIKIKGSVEGVVVASCYFETITYAVDYNIYSTGTYVHELSVLDSRFDSATPTNVSVFGYSMRFEGNRFSTPLTLTNCRGIAPLNLSQFMIDPDDGFASLVTGMTLLVPTASVGSWDLSAKYTFGGNNITIMGNGDGSVLKLANGINDDMLYASSKSGIIIRDLRLNLNKANQTAGSAIKLSAGTNCTVQGVYIHDADEHGVEVDGASTNVRVINCRIVDCDDNGILFAGGSDHVAHNNRIEGCATGVYTAAADDVQITHNVFRTCTTPVNISVNTCDRNVVMGNNTYGCTNEIADSGTGTLITSNVALGGGWLAGDDPG